MKTNTTRSSLLSILALVAATSFGMGCSKSESTPTQGAAPRTDKAPSAAAPTAASKVDAATVKKAFDERCSACHGTSGKGDGAASAALNPKPRDYPDKAWQATVTDEQIKKTILYGGAAVGKSANMPSAPDLDGKPELLDGLVKLVRSFGGA